MPFLENVTRGRGIPRERLDIGRRALPAFRRRVTDQRHQPRVDRAVGPNWPTRARPAGVLRQPQLGAYVEDTVAAMRDNGIRRAAVFTTSAWGGYSSCTQYVEDIARARATAGEQRAGTGQAAPVLRPSAVRGDVHRGDRGGGAEPARGRARRRPAGVHRALHSSCRPNRCGPRPLQPPGGLCVAAGRHEAGYHDYDQVWQSRSGPPQVPWLEPDVADHLVDAGRRRHQGRDRLPHRFRRRPHRGGVGPGLRTAVSRPRSRASRSRGPTPPTPTRVSRGWRST